MSDVLIRDELLDSDRWLDLPSDTDRLAFVGLRLRADSFGNMEAGAKRLFRFLHKFTQVKSEEAAAVTLTHLSDADLIRYYKVETREFLHLPRSRPSVSYPVRKCPPSPWCNADELLGKHIRKVTKQGLAKNLPVTLPERNSDVLLGVGVGVYKSEVRHDKNIAPVDNFQPVGKVAAATWADYWTAQGTALGIKGNPGETRGDYCRRVQALAKART